jgi:hypothetical protein
LRRLDELNNTSSSSTGDALDIRHTQHCRYRNSAAVHCNRDWFRHLEHRSNLDGRRAIWQ